MIPERFDLFGVLYVNPDTDCRHEPPEVTAANLKEICEDYQEEHAANSATPEAVVVVDELLYDIERKVKATDVDYGVSQASATEHSVLVALDTSLNKQKHRSIESCPETEEDGFEKARILYSLLVPPQTGRCTYYPILCKPT